MGQPNYHVAQGFSVGSLIEKCQMMVEQGWVPTGGVCMVIDHQRARWCTSADSTSTRKRFTLTAMSELWSE